MAVFSRRFGFTSLAVFALGGVGGLCAQPANPPAVTLANDEIRMVHGVRTACADEDFEQAQIGAGPYSLRIAVTENGAYVPPRLTLAQGDQTLVRVVCKSDWVMFGLAPGDYTVSAALSDGTPISKRIDVPQDGVVRTALGRESAPPPSS